MVAVPPGFPGVSFPLPYHGVADPSLRKGSIGKVQCGELSLLPQTFTTKVQVVPNATPGVWLATGSDDDDEDVSCGT